jgi:hypothetical protein
MPNEAKFVGHESSILTIVMQLKTEGQKGRQNKRIDFTQESGGKKVSGHSFVDITTTNCLFGP